MEIVIVGYVDISFAFEKWQNTFTNALLFVGPTFSVTNTGNYYAKFQSTGCPNDSISAHFEVFIGNNYITKPLKVSNIEICPLVSTRYEVEDINNVFGLYYWYKEGNKNLRLVE